MTGADPGGGQPERAVPPLRCARPVRRGRALRRPLPQLRARFQIVRCRRRARGVPDPDRRRDRGGRRDGRRSALRAAMVGASGLAAGRRRADHRRASRRPRRRCSINPTATRRARGGSSNDPAPPARCIPTIARRRRGGDDDRARLLADRPRRREEGDADRAMPRAIWPARDGLPDHGPVTARRDVPPRVGDLCIDVVGWTRPRAGARPTGEPGYPHIAECRTGAEGPGMLVDVGWSARIPAVKPRWTGGRGQRHDRHRARHSSAIARLFGGERCWADAGRRPAAPGFAPRPAESESPTIIVSYAVQWFLFAAAALVIYALALRKRLKDETPA